MFFMKFCVVCAGVQNSSNMFQELLKETWFIAALISGIGGAVWIVLCVLGVWLYKCRQKHKKKLAASGKTPKGRLRAQSQNYNTSQPV